MEVSKRLLTESEVRAAARQAHRAPTEGSWPFQIETHIDESVSDGVFAAPDFPGDSADVELANAQGFNGVDRHVEHMMVMHMVLACDYDQIVEAIVQTVSIDMMDIFVREKFATKFALLDPAVFAHRLTVTGDVSISKSIIVFVDPLPSTLPFGFAERATEKAPQVSRLGWRQFAQERFITVGAKDCCHRHEAAASLSVDCMKSTSAIQSKRSSMAGGF